MVISETTMCGIAGFWSEQSYGEDVIRQMTETIQHRGPDELRWACYGQNLWLGHARLKVIDLTESGCQPMTRPGKPGCLVFNGEIYNFHGLRKELEDLGQKFKGTSDSEVLLAAYQAWKQDCVNRIQGMYALAVWDEGSQTFFLARDRAGKKPLYYLRKPGLLVFASEPKAILRHPEVDCGVRTEALPSLTAFGYPPTGESVFDGIQQVPPGTWALFRAKNESWEEKNYWGPRWKLAKSPPVFSAAAKMTRRLLENAVRKRLVSDVPLGAFLSGGLDSTIIVGMMSQMLGRGNVQTFSIGFKGEPMFDESDFAQQAAEHHGTRHTLFRLDPPPFSLIGKLVDLYDAPFADSSAIPTYLVAELARRHVTVVLTGDGGDEIFAGYQRMAAAVMTERIPAWLRQTGSAFLQGLMPREKMGAFARSRREYLWRLAEALGEPMPDRYLRWISVWNRPGKILRNLALNHYGLSDLEPQIRKTWAETHGRKLLGRVLEINYREYLANDLLVKVDRCTMAHGLEARSPFLDQELFEFCATLPVSYHLHGLKGKKLLRAACSDLLPRSILKRRKMGFGIPLGSWLRDAWRKNLEKIFDNPEEPIFKIYDFHQVKILLQEHFSGRSDHGQKIWLILTFSIWLQRFVKK